MSFWDVNLFARRFREMLEDMRANMVRRDEIDFGPNMRHRNIPGTPLWIDSRSVEQNPGDPILLMEVQEIENDYLVCKRWSPSGGASGDDINVAKPPRLRHSGGSVGGVGATTVDAETINHLDEEWVVAPSYDNAIIFVTRSPEAGRVEVEDEPLSFVDLNVDARIWGVVQGFPPGD